MKKILKMSMLILASLLSVTYQLPQEYPLNKYKKPSKRGIEFYVKQNENKFISEYQEFVDDTLYDVYFTVDDLSTYKKDNEEDALGYCISSKGFSEIIITNEEKYIAYEVSMLSKYKRQTILEANTFVKGVIMHELTHLYFTQVTMEMKIDSLQVSSDYYNFSMIPRFNSFGARFIEEGMCMYVDAKMDQIITGNDYIPETMQEITDKNNTYYIMYNYSAVYVRSFADYYGIKKAIQIIVSNDAPSYDEILNPAKYFNRITKP